MKELEIYAGLVKENGTDWTDAQIQQVTQTLKDVFVTYDTIFAGYVGRPRAHYVAPLGSNENPPPTNDIPPFWLINIAYKVGESVIYQGHTYRCLQAHTSIQTWNPIATINVLWKLVS